MFEILDNINKWINKISIQRALLKLTLNSPLGKQASSKVQLIEGFSVFVHSHILPSDHWFFSPTWKWAIIGKKWMTEIVSGDIAHRRQVEHQCGGEATLWHDHCWTFLLDPVRFGPEQRLPPVNPLRNCLNFALCLKYTGPWYWPSPFPG